MSFQTARERRHAGMNGLQTIRMALKSIVGNKVRSLLTMLGIIGAGFLHSEQR